MYSFYKTIDMIKTFRNKLSKTIGMNQVTSFLNRINASESICSFKLGVLITIKNLKEDLQLKFHFVNLMKKEYLHLGKSLTISPMTVMIYIQCGKLRKLDHSFLRICIHHEKFTMVYVHVEKIMLQRPKEMFLYIMVNIISP